MTARARKTEDEMDVAAPLDPEFIARIKKSLADPRPDVPAAEVRAALKTRHEARLKRAP